MNVREILIENFTNTKTVIKSYRSISPLQQTATSDKGRNSSKDGGFLASSKTKKRSTSSNANFRMKSELKPDLKSDTIMDSMMEDLDVTSAVGNAMNDEEDSKYRGKEMTFEGLSLTPKSQKAAPLSTTSSSSTVNIGKTITGRTFAPQESALTVNKSSLKDHDPSIITANDVRSIITSQSFNGSFTIATLQQLINVTSESLAAAFPDGVSADKKKLESIFITAIVCRFFETVHADKKTLWELVVKKSRSWIKKESESIGASGVDWEAAATKFLASASRK